MSGVSLKIAGEEMVLRPEKALWWPTAETLFVSDLHLGKAAAFRAQGLPLPTGPDEATLARLGSVLDATRPTRLIILGDLLHHPDGVSPETLDSLRRWRERYARLSVDLVLGNHDLHAGRPPNDLRIITHDVLTLPPFLATHYPAGEHFVMPGEDTTKRPATVAEQTDLFTGSGLLMRLAGHVHPAVRIGGRRRGALRAPCFLMQERQLVLPAFGEFTGVMMVRPQPGDRVFAVGEDEVIELPVNK